jgi:hypothetical protein
VILKETAWLAWWRLRALKMTNIYKNDKNEPMTVRRSFEIQRNSNYNHFLNSLQTCAGWLGSSLFLNAIVQNRCHHMGFDTTLCVFVHLGVQAAWILVRHFAGGLWLGDYCQGPRMMIDVFDFSGSLPIHCICMHDLDWFGAFAAVLASTEPPFNGVAVEVLACWSVNFDEEILQHGALM